MQPETAPTPKARRSDAARIALGTLTAIPAGARWDPGSARRSLGWYPAVGWLIGLAATSVPFVCFLLGWHGRASAVVGVMILAVLIVASRAMHYDAIADTADAVLGGSTPERRLEIMDDSAVGAFGATAVAFVIVAQAAALTGVVETVAWYAIVIGAVLARFGAVLALWAIKPARDRGLAAPLAGRPKAGTALIAVAFVVALALLPFVGVGEKWSSIALATTAFAGWPAHQVQGFWACLVIGAVAMFAFPWLLSRTVRGVTGDIIGASIAATMMVVLIAGALFG